MGTLSDGSEEELVRELLDDESPFFLLQEEATEFNRSPELNRFNPAVYSGPTINDIENALLVTTRRIQSQELSPARFSVTHLIFYVLVILGHFSFTYYYY